MKKINLMLLLFSFCSLNLQAEEIILNWNLNFKSRTLDIQTLGREPFFTEAIESYIENYAAEVVYVQDLNKFSADLVASKFVLIDRDSKVLFEEQFQVLKKAGAYGVIVISNDEQIFTMRTTGPTFNLAGLMIPRSAGEKIKADLQSSQPLFIIIAPTTQHTM